MAVTNSGMTLYADHDTQESWNGTDDLDDYNMSIQGTNSESWVVSKNSTETGTMTLSANMGTSKYFTMWMKSDLTNYYNSIVAELQSTTNNFESFTIADTTDRDVTGEFHSFCLQFGQGTSTGTLVRTAITIFRAIVNNSTSGNIRSVTNNWIDTMHYGDGRTIAGTTVSDALFLESHTADTATSDEYDGCSEIFPSGLAYQTDVVINTTTGNSYGEVISFAYAKNTDNIYKVSVTGTASFKGTVLIGQDGAIVGFDSTAATSFSWAGGGVTNGNEIKFKSGETHAGLVITACKEVDTNGATLSDSTITGTTETTTGSLVINLSTEAGVISGMQFKNYSNNNRYAIYVPASVTAFSMDNWQFDDPDNTTDYALYWAGTSGTLTISKTNGTNLVSAGCTAASGGTVVAQASVSINVHVEDQSGTDVATAYVYVDEDLGSAGEITNTTTDVNGDITQASYTGAATTATLRVRKYGYKAYLTTITLESNTSTNVILVTDPQQT